MSPADIWERRAGLAEGRTAHVAFRVGRACLWATALLTAKVVVGWLLGVRWFAATFETSEPMRFNSALALFAFAVVGLMETGRGARLRRMATVTVGVSMALLGALVLVEHLVDVSLGIDELLRVDQWTTGPLAPGRPAPQAAAAILCLGLARAVPSAWVRSRDALVVAALMAGFLGLIGHLFGVNQFVVIGGTFGLPVTASAALLLSSVGFALTRPPDATRLSGALADTPGGVLVRRVVPLALLVPVVGAWAHQVLGESGLVDDRAATWIVSLLALVLALVAVARAAAAADQLGDDLARERSRYGGLFDSVLDGIYETTLDGRLVMANDPLAEMLGYRSAKELIASVHSVKSLWVHPERRDDLVGALRAGGEGGVTDVDLRLADGTELIIALSYRPVGNGREGIVGLRGTIRDVTEERARQARLAEVEERFRLAFESGPLGRGVLDLSSERISFVDVNASLAELLGYSIAELESLDPLALVHPDDVAAEATALQRSIEGANRDVTYESRRRHRDGTWIPIAFAGTVLRDANGAPRYAMCTIDDLRPRIAATAALVEATAVAQARERQARALQQLATALVGANDLEALDALACDLVTATLGVDVAAVYERDDVDVWLITGHHGIDERLLSLTAEMAGGDGPSPVAAPLLQAQLERSERTAAIGVDGSSAIMVASRSDRSFTDEEVTFVEAAVALLGLARAREETRARLVRSEGTLSALVDNAPSAVYLFDPGGRCLVANAETARIVGLRRDQMVGRTRAEWSGFDALAAATHRANDIQVLETCAPLTFEESTAGADGVHTYLTVKFPLLEESGEPFGVGGISTDISELRRLEGESKRAWNETLRRIATAVELRDEETGGHVERMSGYAALIASRLGLDAERVAEIGIAAQLHDAGKIGIPDEVLLKPGSLTLEERRIMETHSAIGYRLLAGTGSDLLDLAATIAWTHHERMDGSGYPRQLRGEEIPIEGRIAAVADVFDALTSNRVYRPAMPLADALAILRDGRGRTFDPNVLDALLDNLDEALAISLRHADPGQIIQGPSQEPRPARPDPS